MQTELDAVPEDFDRMAFERAVQRLLAIVPRPDKLRLEVTTDLRASVRDKHPDVAYAAKFEQSRNLAFVVAKVLDQHDGSKDIIVDAKLFSRSSPFGDPCRTLEHEALHVAIDQRGEKLSDIRDRYSNPAAAFGTTLEVAGAACEEYRIERALWAHDTTARPDSHLADFEGTLGRFDAVVRDASRRYQQDRDVARIFRTVGEAFGSLATMTGYVATEYDATGQTRLPRLPLEPARRLLGEAWVELLRTLIRLPPGDTPAERGDLDELAYVVAEHSDEWFAHVGFAWEDRPEGLFFHVLKPADWN